MPVNCAGQYKGPINVRRLPRYEIDAELEVAASGTEKFELVRGRALNISEVGMGGLFVSGWDLGTAVSLEFSVLVPSKPLGIGAVVRSGSGYRYGFEFVELNPANAR